jgi:hypothetical protein
LQVLGLDPVSITIIICIIGVSYRILTGMAGKNWKEFNFTLAATTFMLGIVTSVGLVAPVIDSLPDDLSPTLQLAAVFGQIGLVMGIDAGVRKGQKVAEKMKTKKKQELFEEEPEPIDAPDDLPPGKDDGSSQPSVKPGNVSA